MRALAVNLPADADDDHGFPDGLRRLVLPANEAGRVDVTVPLKKPRFGGGYAIALFLRRNRKKVILHANPSYRPFRWPDGPRDCVSAIALQRQMELAP